MRPRRVQRRTVSQLTPSSSLRARAVNRRPLIRPTPLHRRLILRPSDAETLDTLVTGLTGGNNDYVFGAGRFAPGQLFGLNVRISKTAEAPVVVDSMAFGKLYVSPISLARFEQDAGKTNKSTVRLEGHAAFGVERQAAAVEIRSGS